MRARLALHVSQTQCEVREIKLREKPEAMLDASPKGTVPVLVLSDGRVVDESIDIVRWALARHDPEGWLKGDDRELIATNDGPFKHHLDRYKYETRHNSDPVEHRSAALAILQRLEDRLSAQPYLCGDKPMLADMAIRPFLRQFAATDREWFNAQPLPRLQEWLEEFLTSDLFGRVMVKRKQWQAGETGEALF